MNIRFKGIFVGFSIALILSVMAGFRQGVSAFNGCGTGTECYSVPGGCGEGVGCQGIYCQHELCPSILKPPQSPCYICDEPN